MAETAKKMAQKTILFPVEDRPAKLVVTEDDIERIIQQAVKSVYYQRLFVSLQHGNLVGRIVFISRMGAESQPRQIPSSQRKISRRLLITLGLTDLKKSRLEIKRCSFSVVQLVFDAAIC